MKGLLLTCLSLAALGLASPIARRQNVTPAQLDQLRLYAQWAAGASCNSEKAPGSPVTCAENTCPIPESHRSTVVASFTGEVLDTRGFVAVDPVDRLIVVSFRATTSIRNWIANLIFVLADCDLVADCGVHTGFYASWLEVADEVFAAVRAAKAANPSYSVAVAGYSLGGAVGTIAAAYLRRAGLPADLYTYGSPRVGNAAFARFVTEQAGREHRVTHRDDLVPRLPPLIADFRHVSPEYWIFDGPGDDAVVDPDEVRVCPGYASTECNAGTEGLGFDAHGWYFGSLSGCAPDGTPFLRARGVAGPNGTVGTSDAELEALVSEWGRLDRELARELNG